ncbi:MAG: T9SS type A sorting domain-containing protein, partial [Bacteroidia bacterium]|nr:T9SS type A sorting domain-containing protein [Bacteroidia bacterium]
GYNNGNGPASGTIGNFTIVNSATNSGVNIAPGQGFFVAAANSALTPLVFNSGASGTTDMRTTSGSNDFILSRNSVISHIVGVEISTTSENYRTEFYFNDNSSQGLDPGYDASVYGTIAPEFSIYSHLVQDNTGRDMAIQSLATSDIDDVVVPLGINASQGQQLTVGIINSDLPTNTNVYLEDNLTNNWTLLNTGNYVFTPSADLVGTGRFFLHFTTGTLSAEDNSLNGLLVYSENISKSIVVKGQLTAGSQAVIYDLQGRVVKQGCLNHATSRSQSIDVSNFSAGVYIVQIKSGTNIHNQKVVIK